MKILLVVPDGVGIRNYLYSSFSKEVKAQGFEIQLYHKISNAALIEIQKAGIQIENSKVLPKFKESILIRLFRESSSFARLIIFSKTLNNSSIKSFWGKKSNQITLKLFYIFCNYFGKILALNYRFITAIEKEHERLITVTSAYNKTKQELLNFAPDFILNLHQRAPISSLVIIAAKELAIKNGTIIFSWDNIPKARLICRPQTYFVWSELMKEQLCLLYREINPKDVFIVGSPQFEFYNREEFKMSKESFFKQHNLDIHKKTICFSGDDRMTSPFDQVYLADLCASLVHFPKEETPQIIFRRCPVDFSDRFDKVLEKYKDIITVINPDWKVEKESDKNSFSLVYPAFDDIKLLVNTCLHSDVVVNLGSTMAHDFAVYDKPCLYLNYNPIKSKLWSVEKIYKFEHFKSMENLDAVGFITEKSEFYPLLQKALNTPYAIATERKLWLRKIVAHPIELNSVKLAEIISKKCTSVL